MNSKTLRELIQTIGDTIEGSQDGDFSEEDIAALFANLADLVRSMLPGQPMPISHLLSGVSSLLKGISEAILNGDKAFSIMMISLGNFMIGLGNFLKSKK